MNQFFYRHSKTGEVYCYASEQERNAFGPKELVLMTDMEVSAHLNPPKRSLTRDEVERARLSAYADPFTGSDRFQIEAAADRLSGNEESAMAAEKKWLSRRSEIAAQLPWPESE